MKRVSNAMVGRGIIPESWTLDPQATAIANDALYFCRARLAAQSTSVRVFRRRVDSPATHGRCWKHQGIIALNKTADTHTLSHEIAHFAYSKHGKRHAELTEKIYAYLQTKEKPNASTIDKGLD